MNLKFDFEFDKPSQTVTVTREFAAPLMQVWDAFTKAEVLDQWWSPKPFLSRTKIMDFRDGGKRFYAMVTPDGAENWAIHKYSDIRPGVGFKMWNSFADAEENAQIPGSDWDFQFSEANGITTVVITIYNESLDRMERMLAMGFREGFAQTLSQLSEMFGEC